MEPLIIEFPLGNRSIDEQVHVLNRRLIFEFKAAYSENTNTLHFTSQNLCVALSIGPATTCSGLIGVRTGDTSILGSYTAPNGVNLPGPHPSTYAPTCDPRTLGYSSIIANVPITKPHNGLERFTQSDFTFGLNDRSIYHIIIERLDAAPEPVTFHGGKWQVTLKFRVKEVPAYAVPACHRALIANGSLFGSANIAAGKRADALSGGHRRTAWANPESVFLPRR